MLPPKPGNNGSTIKPIYFYFWSIALQIRLANTSIIRLEIGSPAVDDIQNWFSKYTNLLDLSISLKYVFYIECSGLFSGKPMDQAEPDFKPWIL